MGEQLDYTTLTWVKDEIQESLNQTHQALEAFIEDPTDTTQIRFCATYLHQIYGTLQMVEIYGAALLAEEMEKVANALLNDQIAQKDDAFEVLFRATLQLPNYLESLERGQPDMPVVLTPLLNDMRAARGEPLLSENAFFSPDLDVPPPEKRPATDKSYPEMQSYARKLRPIYQLSLLGVLRDNDSAGSLKKMAAVLRELQNTSAEHSNQRLWWIAGGIIESLIDDGLEKSTALKMLFARIDREIKRVIDSGESAISENPPLDLLKNCLYYTGTSTSNGPRVSALKQAFNLQQLLPYAGTLEQAVDELMGSTSDIMGTVSSVIKDDLLQVKDQLDIFVRNTERNVGDLTPLAEMLSRTADTLAMLGLGELRKIIQDQATQLNQLIESGENPADNILMEAASALLYVESSLDNLQATQPIQSEDEAPDLAVHNEEESTVLLPPSEQTQIANLVIKEARQVLADVKEGFNTFALESTKFELITDTPAKLAQIQGALAVMSLNRAARLLGAANAYIREDIISAQANPTAEKMDTLADAITSIEYYLEAIEEGRGQAEGVLAVAEISVEQLGHPMESVSDIINVETDLTEAEPSTNPPEAEEPHTDVSSTVDLTTVSNTDEIGLAEQVSDAPTETAIDNIAEPSTATNVSSEPEEYQEEDIDEEILEIFVEEADEVLVDMTDCLHAWRANDDDLKSLESLRRSYHTIKGSGRLAGAMVMGDFAWAIENLLNRVMDKKIVAGPATFALLNNAETVVRGLLAHLKNDTTVRPPVKALTGQAVAMADGGEFSINDIVSVTIPVKSSAEPETADPLELDPSAFGEDPLSAEGSLHELETSSLELRTDDDISAKLETTASLELDPSASDEDALSTEDSLSAEDSLSVEDSLPADGSLSVEDSLPVEDSLLNEDLSLTEDFPLVENVIDELGADSLELSADDDTTNVIETNQQLAQYDPILVEVFRKEATTHIAAIRQFLLDARGPSQKVDDDLHRAFHTLHGSARMADVTAISALSEPSDRLIRALHEHSMAIDNDGQALLRQITDAIESLITNFDADNFVAPDNSELLVQISELHERTLGALAPVDTASTPLHDLTTHNIAPDDNSDNAIVNPVGYAITDALADDITPTSGLLLDSLTEDLIEEITEEAIVIDDSSDEFEDLIDSDASFDTNLDTNPDTNSAETEISNDASGVDYDPDLLEIFLEEAEELQESTDQTLQQWFAQNDNLDHVAELQRLLHTLKGGARMANVLAVGDLAHAMESLLERITDKRIVVTPKHIDLIQACHDWLTGALEQAQKLQATGTATELVAHLEAMIKGEEYVPAAAPVPKTPPQKTATSAEVAAEILAKAPEEAPTTITDAPTESTAAPDADDANEMEELATAYNFDTPETITTAKKASTAEADEQVRVRAGLLNNLVNFSGEINIYNSRIAQQLGATRFNLAELDQTVQRLREQLRKFEIETETQIMYRHETTAADTEDFDPLELDRFSTMQQISRGMVESLGDLTSIEALLDNLSGETDVLLLQQQRVTSELQDGLMRTRMVAFSSILPRLRRIMRQTCKETGKEAELLTTGSEGELDRTQLNRIVPALEHILRNAIGHGLEMPKDREAADKPANGNVHIVFSHEGSEVVLTISDDGAGINIDALRKKAIEKGHMLADANLADAEIMEFILQSGFSTADEVTQISGRGVGMDVVNTEVKQLGGTLHIDSTAGQGTTFTLRLPLTVLVNQALMVQVADASYAIQLPNIEHVVRVGSDELEPLLSADQTHFEYADNQYQYLNLGTILHGSPPVVPADRQRVPLMLIRSAEHRIALHVDNLLGRQEIVIKSVGPQLSSVGVLSGATILPSGEVALILDVGNLVRTALAQVHGNATPLLPSIDETAAEKASVPTVMIVDDSITVRKVTERLLNRYDYNIITAKDGVDALTVMIEQVPDIMLLDVEMPRMDGYELATTMRNDSRLKTVPIIMITSRTGDKHRQRALDIGVNMYMGKPYQESELIENIRALTDIKQS